MRFFLLLYSIWLLFLLVPLSGKGAAIEAATNTEGYSSGPHLRREGITIPRNQVLQERAGGSSATIYVTQPRGVIEKTVNHEEDQFTFIMAPAGLPFTMRAVYVVIETFDMQSASLNIYEAESETQSFLYDVYNCQFCKIGPPPPPFYVESPVVFIRIVGIKQNFGGGGFPLSGFRMSYVCIPELMTDMTPQLLDFNFITYSGYGTISPPLIEDLLPQNSVMQWRIDKRQKFQYEGLVTNNEPLLISLSDFAFDPACKTSLRIYDGLTTNDTLLFSGCEMPYKWIYANSRSALVIVDTAASEDLPDSEGLFKITWFGIDEDKFLCGSFEQPDYRYDLSMNLDDGSFSSSPMKTSDGLPDGCAWLIRPRPAGGNKKSKVTLFIHRNSLKQDTELRVYDGLGPGNGKLLWRNDRTSRTTQDFKIVPPPLVTESSSMYVWYKTTSFGDAARFGWSAEYQADFTGSYGIGSGGVSLDASSALHIRIPGDGSSYVAGLNYSWVVQPTTSGVITFAFQDLNIPDCNDTLTIYDGTDADNDPVIGTFCGTNLPRRWITSTASAVLMTFKANEVNSLGGFEVAYFSDGQNYRCGMQSSLNPALMRASSMVLTDGSRSDENIYLDESCKWRIVPERGDSIYLFFDRFHLFGAAVKIYKGTGNARELLNIYSDSDVCPAPMFIDDPGIEIEYDSESSASGKGFSLTYFSTNANETGPGRGPINIRSSIVYGLKVPKAHGTFPVGKKVKWLISPQDAQTQGSLYFILAPSGANISCSDSYLRIYAGSNEAAPLVGTYCASNPPQEWLELTSSEAFITFQTPNASSLDGEIDITFYSDSPATKCGIGQNPAIMTSRSGIITDGSSTDSNELLRPDQLCEWLIQPSRNASALAVNNNTMVYLDFLSLDMRGGSLEVWNGNEDVEGRVLLFKCNGCQVVPRPILSPHHALFVSLRTNATADAFGKGFRAIWSTSDDPAWNAASTTYSGSYVLEHSRNVDLDISNSNATLAWHLRARVAESSLMLNPYLTVTAQEQRFFDDGRVINGSSSTLFTSTQGIGQFCGNLGDIEAPYLRTLNGSTMVRATQLTDKYVYSADDANRANLTNKYVKSIGGSFTYTSSDTPLEALEPSGGCKYILTSGSLQAIRIDINRFKGAKGGASQLIIYAGKYGNDAILYDSSLKAVDVSTEMKLSVVAPCGKAVVVVYSNSTGVDGLFGLDIDYSIVSGDLQFDLCQEYYISLLPKKTEIDFLTPILYTFGTLIVFSSVIFSILYVKRHWNDQPKMKKFKVIVPHPPHTPKLDAFRNKFLGKGTCVVCRDHPIPVFKLNCSHKICLEDLKGYLESALGDISVFPLKCPMHYEGCGGDITGAVAKRVLAKSQYDRFLEFHDRAIYGDGMRCIFCNNFVNFPLQETISMVECPYCVQKFCMRCKKPWHYGGKCPLEKLDAGLESWMSQSGASSCPVCRKIIEKDDPDTCNHMVHKVTDAIPCIRDRTDYCYLCGFEVAGTYPHIEIDNPSVNHFPDGVFQKCRIKQKQEKEAERDRLRKMRRSKNKNGTKTPGRVAPNADDMFWDTDYKEDGENAPEQMTSSTAMDVLWNNSAPSSPTRQLPPLGSQSPGSPGYSPNARLLPSPVRQSYR